MRIRNLMMAVAAVATCAVVMVGCASGSGSTSAQSAAAGSAGSASASAASSAASAGSAASSAASGASASAASSGMSASTAAASGDSATADEDFDRIVVGTWKIYSMEASKGNVKKVGPDVMAVLRDFGLHDYLTFFHDGTFQIDRGRGDVSTLDWRQVGYNELELEGMLDDPVVQGDEGEGKVVNAKIASGKMTLEYEDSKNGTVKLVYVKQ